MKKFVLIVKHQAGPIAFLTQTPDLVDAIQEFKKEFIKTYGQDKGNMLPDILKAELIPLSYTSVYEV